MLQNLFVSYFASRRYNGVSCHFKVGLMVMSDFCRGGGNGIPPYPLVLLYRGCEVEIMRGGVGS